jgi:hypothetical protein
LLFPATVSISSEKILQMTHGLNPDVRECAYLLTRRPQLFDRGDSIVAKVARLLDPCAEPVRREMLVLLQKIAKNGIQPRDSHRSLSIIEPTENGVKTENDHEREHPRAHDYQRR